MGLYLIAGLGWVTIFAIFAIRAVQNRNRSALLPPPEAPILRLNSTSDTDEVDPRIARLIEEMPRRIRRSA